MAAALLHLRGAAPGDRGRARRRRAPSFVPPRLTERATSSTSTPGVGDLTPRAVRRLGANTAQLPRQADRLVFARDIERRASRARGRSRSRRQRREWPSVRPPTASPQFLNLLPRRRPTPQARPTSGAVPQASCRSRGPASSRLRVRGAGPQDALHAQRAAPGRRPVFSSASSMSRRLRRAFHRAAPRRAARHGQFCSGWSRGVRPRLLHPEPPRRLRARRRRHRQRRDGAGEAPSASTRTDFYYARAPATKYARERAPARATSTPGAASSLGMVAWVATHRFESRSCSSRDVRSRWTWRAEDAAATRPQGFKLGRADLDRGRRRRPRRPTPPGLRRARRPTLAPDGRRRAGDGRRQAGPRSPTIVGGAGHRRREPARLGLIAGETSRAYPPFTLSYVTGRSVGIGAYLVRLGQRIIQKGALGRPRGDDGGPMILTGFQALNKLLGREVYTLAGPARRRRASCPRRRRLARDRRRRTQRASRRCCAGSPYHSAVPTPSSSRGAARGVGTRRSRDPVIDRDVEWTPPKAPYDPRHMLGARPDVDGKFMPGFFDEGSFTEYLAGWGKSVVVGRAKLGGVPMGVIAVETRLSEPRPADPPTQTRREPSCRRRARSGSRIRRTRRRRPSATSTRARSLPIMIFANWRGFSGGTRDMYGEVLKFGAMIVDALVDYDQPVTSTSRPTASCAAARGVVDPTINEARDGDVRRRRGARRHPRAPGIATVSRGRPVIEAIPARPAAPSAKNRVIRRRRPRRRAIRCRGRRQGEGARGGARSRSTCRSRTSSPTSTTTRAA